MPITYGEIGSGITKRPVVTITNPLTAEDCEELRRRQPATPCTIDFDYRIVQLEVKAQQILREKGLPLPVSKPVRVLPDGSWCEVDADILEKVPGPGDHYATSLSLATGDCIDSLQGYAARILFQIEELHRAQARKDMQLACLAAGNIRALDTEARMKALWETHALSGEKSQQGASQSGKIRAAKHQTRDEHIRTMARQFWRGKPKKDLSATALYIHNHWPFNTSHLSINSISYIINH
jgi:hypothetical protein